jgi:peptidoglycan/LPS O-acetylase OafA/YrhL
MPEARQHRMAWLDALRAVAALLVVYAHLSHHLLRGAREISAEWLHAGTAGVMLFFLVSGYIIPASLERHGDLRTFWINRLARLLPLYAVVALVVVAALPQDPYLSDHPAIAAVAHASMLTHLLGVPLITPVFWTLTFEMAFYLMVSALYALRAHRASGTVAVILAGAAVLTAPLTPGRVAGPVVAVTAAVALVLGLAALTSGRRAAAVAGAALLLTLAGTLLTAGQDGAHVWDGLLIPAVMFVGATVFRAEHGQISRRQAATVATVVAAALLFNWLSELSALNALTPRYVTRSLLTLAVIGATFALGMAARGRRVPRSLAWVGLVSYSVYLVHVPLIALLGPALDFLEARLRGPWELLAVGLFLAVLFGVSWAGHHFVEVPGQRLGRWLIRQGSRAGWHPGDVCDRCPPAPPVAAAVGAAVVAARPEVVPARRTFGAAGGR